MLEREIERYLTSEVKKLGGLCYKFISPGSPGVPDRIIVTKNGTVIFAELKAETGRLSKLQALQINKLAGRGAHVKVIKGRAEAEAFVEELREFGI